MKTFRMFARSFRDAFKSVVRNFSLSLASVSCITITLIIIAASLLISENVKNFTTQIKEDVTVVVFLDNDTTEQEQESFVEKLKKVDNIESYEFKSKLEVKETMSKDYSELSGILDGWEATDNPLKDTYTIKVKDVEIIKKTAEELEKIEKVNTVQYGEGLVEKLVGVFDAIEKTTLIAAGALALVTIFLIINTIKLTIFSRKDEIFIMRLVGASNTRIKLPFIVEGIVLGIIGAIIPILIITIGYSKMFQYFGGQLFSPIIKLIEPNPFIYQASVLILAIGMVVGMLGSARAVRRYINK